MALNKGQMFIVGGLIFASLLLSIVIVVQGGELFYSGGESPSEFFENSVSEFPSAVNNALADNRSAYSLRRGIHSFMGFQVYSGRGKGLDTRAHSLVLVPNSTGLKAVVSNFRGEESGARITVGGETRRFELGSGVSRVVHFGSVPERFEARLEMESEESFDNTFPASRNRVKALYSLKVSSESQTWVDTRIY